MNFDDVRAKYDVIESPIQIASDTSLRIAHVRDINALVDAMDVVEFGPDERLPYWATPWPAGLGLARHVFSCSGLQQPVIELGAGLGLCSLAAAHRGLNTLATDYEEDAIGFIRHNAALNALRVETLLFDWRSAFSSPQVFRTILASDVLYEAKQAQPLAERIEQLLDPQGVALIADPGRPHVATFEQLIRARGFFVDLLVEDDIVILRITLGQEARNRRKRRIGGG